jgi:hypothetical protein
LFYPSISIFYLIGPFSLPTGTQCFRIQTGGSVAAPKEPLRTNLFERALVAGRVQLIDLPVDYSDNQKVLIDELTKGTIMTKESRT